MFRRLVFLFIIFMSAHVWAADPYWVDDNGTETTWGNCQSASPVSGASACNLATANSNASAGDTVNLRAGTYTVSGTNRIDPTNSGSSGNEITYQAYNSEVVTLEGDGSSDQSGVRINGVDYIIVKDIIVKDCFRSVRIIDGADHNEIDNCTLYHSAAGQYSSYIGLSISDNGGDPSTHNWVHDCTIHTMGLAACGEGFDIIKIGSATEGDNDSNYNTIEDNVFYHAGHTLTDCFTQYNVWRNNIGHNEGWKTDPTGCDYGPDPPGSNPGDGKFGHRCFALYKQTDDTDRYNLFEGNRSGYASVNPNNNGADGLTLSSSGNIIRHNFFFGTDGPGIYLKNSGQTTDNRIYSNTVYKAGQYTGDPGEQTDVIKTSLMFTYSDPNGNSGNVLKNNILYDSGEGDITCAGTGCGAYVVANNTFANNMCDSTDSDYGCTAGTPTFVSTDMLDMTSLTLPDLAISGSSAGIDGGTHLTQANGSGSDSTTLIVDDALYFQDGTWGSSLSSIEADYIAIGTVGNVVQISSINYGTNTITLSSAMTWSDDASIWLSRKSDGDRVLYGSAPDQGANEWIPIGSVHGGGISGGSIN
jgi:hypothetical protein